MLGARLQAYSKQIKANVKKDVQEWRIWPYSTPLEAAVLQKVWACGHLAVGFIAKRSSDRGHWKGGMLNLWDVLITQLSRQLAMWPRWFPCMLLHSMEKGRCSCQSGYWSCVGEIPNNSILSSKGAKGHRPAKPSCCPRQARTGCRWNSPPHTVPPWLHTVHWFWILGDITPKGCCSVKEK